MGLTPGTRIGSYEILSALGAGGMGEVYRARDTRLDRDVALKILPDLFAADADRLARFEREAKALAALNHPNIAAIYGIEGSQGDGEGTRALVMELVEGEDLSAQIERGPLAFSEALPLARQIADALEAAHEAGIVHRDLKPANIKVRPDGTLKVLDFGLAKAADPAGGSGVTAMNSPTLTARATQMGMIIGTAAYMAPEQARGRSIDRRADIWAFGVVLFEMLTGRRAFEGDDISVTLASVIKDDVPWAALPADLPSSVRRLLRRCLEKDPKQRLSAIGDARLELADADDREEVPASAADSAAPRASWPMLLAAAAAGVVVTGLAMYVVLRPAPTVEVSRLSIMAPGNAALFPDSRQSAISPDGRMVAFVTGSPSGLDATQLWVRKLDGTAATLMQGATGAQLPFWSPDSQVVAFFSEGKLKTIPADGGRASVLCDVSDARGGAWGNGGVIVFAPTSAGPLMRIDVKGGEPSSATALDAGRKETGHRFPSFLPDGRHFLYAALPAHSGDFDILVGALDSADSTPLLKAGSAAVYTDPGFLFFSRKGQVVAQRFDPGALALVGEPVVFSDAPGAIGNQFSSGAAVTASKGALLYLNDPFSDTRLAWVDRDGRESGTVQAAAARYTELKLSPDNQHLAVVRAASASSSAVWVLDLQRNGATRIADNPGLNYMTAWSPDGKRLAYASDQSGTEQVFVRDAAAAMPQTQVFDSPALFKKPQSWSPDGAFVMFTQRSPETQNDLLTVQSAGGATGVAYLASMANEDSAQFSPDGRWVAYMSDESGTNDVYVRSFPQPDHKYRVTTDGGTRVAWNASGTQLLVLGADERQLKVADVKPGTELSIGIPKVVGALPPDTIAWDASRDLQRMLVSLPAAGSPGLSLTVVSNWMALVPKR